MGFNLALPKMKIKAFGIVRDTEGRPKFADPFNIPPEIMQHLSEEDLRWVSHLQRQRETSSVMP